MDRPDPDYPAAHSMDTEWYAVDRDGHVALFDSGEGGAMPIGAHTENDTHRDDLAKVVPKPPYRLLDWLGDSTQEHHIELPTPARTGPTPRVHPDPSVNVHAHYRIIRQDDGLSATGRAEGLGPTLLFLGSLDAIRAEAGPYSFSHTPAAEGVAVFFADLSPWIAWKLHESGQCLGCFRWPGEGHLWALLEDLPARLGLFYYKHDPKAETWISGTYLRKEPPTRPLRIDQLPTEIREAIAKVRFEHLSFSEAGIIQPIPTFPCRSWRSNYLDPDGVTVRPIPGGVTEYNPADSADDVEIEFNWVDEDGPHG